MSAASAACILQFLLLRPLSALDVPAPVYGYAIAMAVLSTAVPVFMTSEALRRVGANTVAIVGALGPVTTIAFGWLGLEEVMTPLQLAGSALVLVGVVVISLRPAAPAKDTSEDEKTGFVSAPRNADFILILSRRSVSNRRPCGVACPARSSSG
jgi:drug/metabolite transporter (DMT)-like permease